MSLDFSFKKICFNLDVYTSMHRIYASTLRVWSPLLHDLMSVIIVRTCFAATKFEPKNNAIA